MAASNTRSAEEVRREIEARREDLAGAVETLRRDLGAATDVAGKLRANLPTAAAAAVGVGFVLAGGIGAVFRVLARRDGD